MTTTNTQEFTSLFQDDGFNSQDDKFNSLFDPVVGLSVPERKDPPRDGSDIVQGFSTGIEGLKVAAFGFTGALADSVGAEAIAKFSYGQGAAIENFIESDRMRCALWGALGTAGKSEARRMGFLVPLQSPGTRILFQFSLTFSEYVPI